jgi:hypothetical protein
VCNHTTTFNTSPRGYSNAAKALAQQELQVNAIIDKETGRALEYRHLIKSKHKHTWFPSCANKFGRLTQGIGNHEKGTNTMFFVPRKAIPKDRMPTYARFVVD